jgi:hypothetical protein
MDQPRTNELANVIPRSSGLYQKNRLQFVHILPQSCRVSGLNSEELFGSPLRAHVEKATPQFFAKFVMRV